MQLLNYMYDETGEKSALLLSLKDIKNLSLEELEDIQDIVDYELSKHLESLEYDTEIERILKI